MSLRDGLVLYHGSYTEVPHPNLSRCANFKDFGRGFYLTSSRSQARSFAKISTRKAMKRGISGVDARRGYVSRFVFNNTASEALHILEFAGATTEWLQCVVAHRRPRSYDALVKDLAAYDVIAGKIADDQTNITLTLYMDGIFGEVGSEKAMRRCIDELLPNRLNDQFCFRSKRVLSCLRFEGSEVVWT